MKTLKEKKIKSDKLQVDIRYYWGLNAEDSFKEPIDKREQRLEDIQECRYWDSETDALTEVWNRGFDFCKKETKNKLKQEVIKLIKEKYNPDKTTMEIADWINFFNLTEEDLK